MTAPSPALVNFDRIRAATFAVERIPDAERPKASRLEWRVRVVYPGGETAVVPHTLRATEAEAIKLHQQIDSCGQCRLSFLRGGPSHKGSTNCPTGESLASGGDRAHCDCSGCWGGRVS